MTPKNLKAFILAAGFGTRLKSLTQETPKALIPFMNQPMLFHVLEQIEKTGIKEVCINAHYKWQDLEKALQSYKGPLKINLSKEKKILGTGGGIAAVENWRKESDLLVINADIIHTFNLSQIIEEHYKKSALVTLALTKKPHPGLTKIWCSEDNICSFGEATHPKQTAHGFACIHLISSELLRTLPQGKDYSIIPIYQKLLKKKQMLHAYISSEYWVDMGTPEKYLSSLYDFAMKIKNKIFLQHPAFKDPDKSLEEYEKIIQKLKKDHPHLFEELQV